MARKKKQILCSTCNKLHNKRRGNSTQCQDCVDAGLCSLCKNPYDKAKAKQSRRCHDCINAYQRAWAKNNPSLARERKRTLLKNNPVYRENQYASSKRWSREQRAKRKTDPLLHEAMALAERDHDLRFVYGITLQQYNDFLTVQRNRCAICLKEETTKGRNNVPIALSVDHCHTTGVVRGLLCKKCNHGIGYFYESPKLLEMAAKYLENEPAVLHIPLNNKFISDEITRWLRSRLKKEYNITQYQYTQLLSQQNNRCAICLNYETSKRFGKITTLSIDHNHKTSVVRGLLCRRCNSAIATFDDSPDRLRTAITYLNGKI